MATIALQQVSSRYAIENSRRTLEKPIRLDFLASRLPVDLFARLQEACKDGLVYVWGSKAERSHQTYKMLSRAALVLFRQGPTVFKFGVVIEKTENPAVGESLWGRDRDGKIWSTIYFFARLVNTSIPAATINGQLGRSTNDHWQGLVVLNMKDAESVDEFFRKQLNGL